MIQEVRQRYNQAFTPEKYEALLNDISAEYNCAPSFRVAETPVFISESLKNQLVDACKEICDLVTRPEFSDQSRQALTDMNIHIPGDGDHPRFIQADFGICHDENGNWIPQMVEVQGFPSLYFFQDQLALAYRRHFDIPMDFGNKLGGMDSELYHSLLRETIIGDHDPENVVILEIEPHGQVTSIDLLGASSRLGVELVCISDVRKRGRELFYENEDGKEIPIKRIFNRVILDDLEAREGFQSEYQLGDEVDVEWVEHPAWYFRLSKYTLPLFNSRYVPETLHLSEIDAYPEDLENYLLKPIFSFAGKGVVFDVTAKDLDDVKNPKNYILQRKVEYMPLIESPEEPVKAEVRMMMIWPGGHDRPVIINNLIRLSKDRMIGVRYNKDKDWVGASIGFFQNETPG